MFGEGILAGPTACKAAMLVSLRSGPCRGPVRSCIGHQLPGRRTDTWSRFENYSGQDAASPQPSWI